MKVIKGDFSVNLNNVYREIHELLEQPKYKNMSCAEIVGVLEMIKIEYTQNWVGIVNED